MGLFGTTKTGAPTEKEVASMVTKYFERRHLDIGGHQLKAEEGLGWWISEGSAKVYIFVLEDRKGQVLRITAPILYFPEHGKEEFFQRLLEINRDLSGVAIATFKNVVLVSAQRSTRGLDQEELNDLIWSVSFVADKIDDELAQEFNAKHYTDADG